MSGGAMGAVLFGAIALGAVGMVRARTRRTAKAEASRTNAADDLLPPSVSML
jgi:hypothetical protein